MKFSGFVAAFVGVLGSCAAFAEKAALAPSAPPPSPGGALEAVGVIPKDAAKNLARIEAREGHPNPERWYVIVYDPSTPTGVREFVVAGGRIAAARQISQFSDTLTEPDAFGDAWVRADSDYCVRLGQVYAAVNGLKAAAFDYELARPAPNAPPTSAPKTEVTWPIWRVTVLDGNGDQLGMLTISAARGTVLAHDGFEKEPSTIQLPTPPTPPPASVLNPKPPPKTPTPKAGGKKGKKG